MLSNPKDARIGLVYGLAAYFTWGVVPAYFKLLKTVPPIQVLSHRVVWSVLFLVPLIYFKKLWPDVRKAFGDRKTLLSLCASTTFIAINWFTFIYGVATNRILLTSLGYFMTPLVSVLLGVIFLKERLRLLQVISLIIATAAVVILTLQQGEFPMLAVILALSFSLYGLMRKTTPAGPLVGLFVETTLLLPIGLVMIVSHLIHPWTAAPGAQILPADESLAQLLHHTPLLIAAGVITAVPLLWFAGAARRLRLSTLGLLQYTAPTVSFLLALIFYHEPFTPAQRIAFSMIWAALILFSADSVRAYRAAQPAEKVKTPHPEELCLNEI